MKQTFVLYVALAVIALFCIIFAAHMRLPSSDKADFNVVHVAEQRLRVATITLPANQHLMNSSSVHVSLGSKKTIGKQILPDRYVSPRETIKMLFHMAIQSPAELVSMLESGTDPFALPKSLSSNSSNGPYTYSTNVLCPPASYRIDFPRISISENAYLFKKQQLERDSKGRARSREVGSAVMGGSKQDANQSFIFYQHLRKAGGTGFCDLATMNMGRETVPGYYCMPDNRGSLATPPWSDAAFLVREVEKKGFRIVANEWDAFEDKIVKLPNVVLATTFRHPIDRWYSQFRFEHLERRDGSTKDSPRMSFLSWYNAQKGWTTGQNYYVKTFIGSPNSPRGPDNIGDFYWTYHKFNKIAITWELFEKALENVRKFHVLLVTELLDTSQNILRAVLGWHVAQRQILPHESQAVRKNKKSLSARQVVPSTDYAVILQENIFDFLLFHIVKRIYMERLVCEDSENNHD